MVNIANQFGSIIKKQRNPLTYVLMILILIKLAPTEVLGNTINSQLKKVMNPINSIMQHVFVRLFLWLALLWSCCWGKDLNLFILIAVYFISR